jgi:nitroreductase
MDFFETIRLRRSVRRYTPETVPNEIVEKALDAALMAPNSSNLQHWEFFWVSSPEKKAEVAQACLFQGTARTAQHLIVAVARIDRWKKHRDAVLQNLKEGGTDSPEVQQYYNKIIPFLYTLDPVGALTLMRNLMAFIVGIFKPIYRGPYGKKGLFEVAIKSTALACENFMLAVAAQGYGSCPMEGFDEVRLKKILGLGSKARLVMVISVGATDPKGIWGRQFRVPRDWVVNKI